jgi:hypothetical protein
MYILVKIAGYSCTELNNIVHVSLPVISLEKVTCHLKATVTIIYYATVDLGSPIAQVLSVLHALRYVA